MVGKLAGKRGRETAFFLIILIPTFLLVLHHERLTNSTVTDEHVDVFHKEGTFNSLLSVLRVIKPTQLRRPDVLATPKPLPFRLVLRYTVCGGLINQQYGHISAFAVAQALGAEIVLPLACYRESFNQRYSLNNELNSMHWHSAPLETLMDVERLITTWKQWGFIVHKTPNNSVLPDQTAPQTAFAQFDTSNSLDSIITTQDADIIVQLNDIYRETLPLSDIVDRSLQLLMDKHSETKSQALILDLPCTFFSTQTEDILPLTAVIAETMEFPPNLIKLADKIREVMTHHGKISYNGVHLRVEKDATDWMLIMGGPGAVWHKYVRLMGDMGMNQSQALYVASGLASAKDETNWELAQGLLLQHASHILCKERFVPDWELENLHTEQLALLDLLILKSAKTFVGFAPSTFSHYIKEYRYLHGLDRRTSALVNSTKMKSSVLFDKSGLIAP